MAERLRKADPALFRATGHRVVDLASHEDEENADPLVGGADRRRGRGNGG